MKVYDVSSGTLEDSLDVVRDGDEQCKDAVYGVSYFHHSNTGSGAGKYNGLRAVAVGSRRFYEQ